MWDIPMKKGNILHEKNTDGDFSAVDGWIFSKQKCEERQKGNHLQQSPLLKWELVRLGQQPPSNHLQQSPQAKGELPGDCWESVFEKISEESSLETRVEQLPGNSPLAWGNCWG